MPAFAYDSSTIASKGQMASKNRTENEEGCRIEGLRQTLTAMRELLGWQGRLLDEALRQVAGPAPPDKAERSGKGARGIARARKPKGGA